MAINKYMRAALKLLSHVDIKKNYKRIRQVQQAARKPRIKLTYKTWDYAVKNGACSVPIRIFSPDKLVFAGFADTRHPVIVFFHGGGWVTNDIDTYEKTCLTIARQTKHMVIAVDYRLAPEHPFPAALEDCCAVVRSVMRQQRLAGTARKIILMGDSAGGNLAAAVSLYLRDKGEQLPDKQILIYPATFNDHTDASPFPSIVENGADYVLTSKHICDYMDMYCGDAINRQNPYCAPLLAGDFSRQPETLVITAQFDPLRDEGEAYAHALAAAGNRVVTRRIPNAIHGYFTLSIRFNIVKESYRMINHFLEGETAAHEQAHEARMAQA